MQKTKNKGFVWLFTIYVGLFLADVTTTLMSGEIAQYLETNPLFRITNSFIPVILINFFVIYMLWTLYNIPKSKPFWRFYVITTMIGVSFNRIFAIQNAIFLLKYPPTLQQAIAISTSPAIKETAQCFSYGLYLPLIVSLASYYIFSIDHKVEKCQKDYL